MEEKQYIIDHTKSPIEINGNKIVFSKSWEEEDKHYTAYIGECGTVWIEQDGDIYEYVHEGERAPEEVARFNQELIDYLKSDDES